MTFVPYIFHGTLSVLMLPLTTGSGGIGQHEAKEEIQERR